MRIITQDGNGSVEFDGNTLYQQDDTICIYVNNHNWRLGKYGSEKEASDVFMEIHNQWSANPLSVFEMPLAHKS